MNRNKTIEYNFVVLNDNQMENFSCYGFEVLKLEKFLILDVVRQVKLDTAYRQTCCKMGLEMK